VYRHRGRQRPHARPFPIDARLGPRLPIGGGPPPSAIAPFRHRPHTLEPIQGGRRPGKKPVPRMPLARRRCRPGRPAGEKPPLGPKIPSTHFRRRPPMRSGEKPSASTITRRGFLKRAGAAAGAAGLAPAISAPFVADALAQTKTLRIIQWSHFVPQYDTWFDAFAKDWGKQNGISVTVDHSPHLEVPARAAAEVAAEAGHDLFHFAGAGGPHLYEKHLVDLTSLIAEVEKKHGKVQQIGRQIAYNEGSRTWSA